MLSTGNRGPALPTLLTFRAARPAPRTRSWRGGRRWPWPLRTSDTREGNAVRRCRTARRSLWSGAGSQLEGFGLEDQDQIVRRWCREHGHRLVKLFIEKAVSGTVAGDERPELGAALSWIEDKKADGIVAPNLDRLARELVVQEAALAQTWKHGGRAFMADQGELLPDEPEDPTNRKTRRTGRPEDPEDPRTRKTRCAPPCAR
ncbi:recombinase family protein [Streptomyces citrinus]|uniref:recombinase family protein n=1 Tax=Streptomyces citrinus TaxID=3118173 RepID=UPI003CC5F4BB